MIDLAFIALWWSSFALFLYRATWANNLKEFVAQYEQKHHDSTINFEILNYWYQIFTYCLASCLFLATLRCAKLFRADTRIYAMILTLKDSLVELLNFAFVFILCWMAFVQLMYLLFNTSLLGYSSLTASMKTLLQINLGIFNANDYTQSQPILGPLIFAAYNIVIVLVLLNLLVAIIVRAFQNTRENTKKERNENSIDLIEFLVKKLCFLIGIKRSVMRVDKMSETILIEKMRKSVIKITKKLREVPSLTNYLFLFK